jgi:hypothetical protein
MRRAQRCVATNPRQGSVSPMRSGATLTWAMLLVLTAGCPKRPPVASAVTIPADAVEPPQTPEGLDDSTLPARFPSGTWLSFISDPLTPGIVVEITVNGLPTEALLDTGATTSLIGARLAAELGVKDPRRYRAEAYDAELLLGDRRWPSARFNVLPNHAFGVVIGRAALADVDLYVALDERRVGVFDAGQAPTPAKAGVLDYLRYPDGVSYVDAFLLDVSEDRYRGPITMLVDTGASSSSFPERFLAGYPTIGTLRASTVTGLHVAARYAAGHVVVGRRHVPLGDLYPWASRARYGLLGLDALRRFDVVISASRARLWLSPTERRPPIRTLGPRGALCERDGRHVPCVAVFARGHAPTELCASLSPAYVGRRLALEVGAEHEDGSPAWGGALMTLFVDVPAVWENVCRPIPIAPSTEAVWRYARLTLEAFYAPHRSPCPERPACLATSGALPAPQAVPP